MQANYLPTPYMVTPLTAAEAATGKPTLIALGDLDDIVHSLKAAVPDRTDLIEKFTQLIR